MKNEKDIFDMLHSADDNTIENIAEEFPQYDKNEADRIYREVEKRIAMKTGDFHEDAVSGVEHIKNRPVWIRPLALAASFVLIAGTVAGSIALMKNAMPDKNTQSAAVATTQTTMKKEDIDQDYIIALTQNCTDSFDRLYAKYTVDRSDDLSDYDNNHSEYELQLDKQNAFKWSKSTDRTITCYDYQYAGRNLTVIPEEGICNVQNANSPLESDLNIYLNRADTLNSDTKDKWSITGYDTVCGKECAVVEYKESHFNAEKESNFSAEIFIDIKTGIVMKEIADYDSEDSDCHNECIVTEIRYDDEAGDFVTPPEFKKFIEDGNYTIDYLGNDHYERVDKDLSFLDMPQGQQTSTADATSSSAVTAAETATETETVSATEAETVPVTGSETEKVTEAETAPPATQALAEIDQDYILDLVSNNKSSINRLYAKIKVTSENYVEAEKKDIKYIDDKTIQYDKNKDCFCEYNDETNEHYAGDMIIYKGKIAAAYKWNNNYHIISNLAPGAVTDNLDSCIRGEYPSVTLDQLLAQKDKWSMTGRETVNGKDCAVIEYNNNDHGLLEAPVKYLLYIDIKTGIVIKCNRTYYDNALRKEIVTISTFEITELKLNDDAPALEPSDFKKYIVDNGFKPENEESKDISFLDE